MCSVDSHNIAGRSAADVKPYIVGPVGAMVGGCRVLHVTRHTSHVSRHTSHVTHRTSHLTPHTSLLTPHTSHLTPHTSHLTPQTSHLTSHLTHHTSHLTHYLQAPRSPWSSSEAERPSLSGCSQTANPIHKQSPTPHKPSITNRHEQACALSSSVDGSIHTRNSAAAATAAAATSAANATADAATRVHDIEEHTSANRNARS